jgi:hypothetical protein
MGKLGPGGPSLKGRQYLLQKLGKMVNNHGEALYSDAGNSERGSRGQTPNTEPAFLRQDQFITQNRSV